MIVMHLVSVNISRGCEGIAWLPLNKKKIDESLVRHLYSLMLYGKQIFVLFLFLVARKFYSYAYQAAFVLL